MSLECDKEVGRSRLPKRLIIAAGGTGGHIYPALAVAQALAAKGVEILWIGVRNRMEEKIVPKYFPIRYIDMRPLRGRGLKEMMTNPFYFLKSIRQSKKIIKNFKAQAVLTMGGFVCAPVGLAAKRCKVPLVIHEQNAIAGWTNELLARWADQVLEAFPNAFKGPGAQKATCVGNPLRADILQYPIIAASPSKPLKVLVIGGSQGAQYLNTIVAQSLAPFIKGHAIDVLHQAGAGKEALVVASYGGASEQITIKPFLDNMDQAYAWADLVISRSGALSVSEIACLGKPSILVPFPGAVGDHQRYNADFLVRLGGALLIDQKQAGREDWTAIIQSLIDDPKKLTQMSGYALKMSHRDATDKVVAICGEYL
jgi:UDP-N-acetylglucosamine--N-acetylmuramyl-(pentapeptide) pyrophosphoryl-undecaprenol N-acetylglucosamine transferase